MNEELLNRINACLYYKNGATQPAWEIRIYQRKPTRSKKHPEGFRWQLKAVTSTVNSGILGKVNPAGNYELVSFYGGKEITLNSNTKDFTQEYLYVRGKGYYYNAYREQLGEVTMAVTQDHHGNFYRLIRTDYNAGPSEFRFADKCGQFRGTHRCQNLFELLAILETDFDTDPAILTMILSLRKKPFERFHSTAHKEGVCPMCGYAVEYMDTTAPSDKAWKCPFCGAKGWEEMSDDGDSVYHHDVRDHSGYRFNSVIPIAASPNPFHAIRSALPKSRPTKGNFWSDGDMILCRTEAHANILADLLDCMGFTGLTGYYDPDEEVIHDDCTGWYYVDID